MTAVNAHLAWPSDERGSWAYGSRTWSGDARELDVAKTH